METAIHKKGKGLGLFGVLVGCLASGAMAAESGETLVFSGMSDASAAVAVGGDRFVAATDEDNILRFYRTGQPGKPTQTCDLNRLWFTRKKAPEMDLEGAARLGQRIFWIGSHGQNAEGKLARHRHAFFALELVGAGDALTLRPVGRIYTNLIADLSRDARYAGFDLATAATRAPKSPGGLSIEALVDTPDGSLLIGFRNPIPAGRALLVPLLNPAAVVGGLPPRFGDPLRLELGGLGLRGAGRVGTNYFLIAGAAGSGSRSRLSVWKGGDDVPLPLDNRIRKGMNPESICFPEFNGRRGLLLLNDDSSSKSRSKSGSSLPESERRFRGFSIELAPEDTQKP